MNKKEFIAINTKESTKATLLDALKGLPKSVTDGNLLERVKYTLAQAAKSARKVTVADLSELVAEAQSLLNAASAPAPVEAAKKPTPKKGGKLPAKKTESKKEEDETEETKEKDAPAPAKKKGMKLSTPKTKASKELPVASMFPSELTIEADDGNKTLTCAHDKYHTMDKVREALENGKTLFIATYWSKRHIKEYNYANTFHLDPTDVPKSFADDLDILNAVVACDEIDRLWAMSIYTEGMYYFDADDFKPVEDEDPKTNEKFTVRASNGMEFEVYECEDDE